MAQTFLPVPDWFSWENQDAGIAVSETPAGGHDLVVLMVDNGPGTNRGLYRIGRDLDEDGTVAEWGPDWLGVPTGSPGRIKEAASRSPRSAAYASCSSSWWTHHPARTRARTWSWTLTRTRPSTASGR